MNDLNKYFEYKCWKGLEERGLQDKQVYREKLKYEIDIILKMGFPGYFLIVQDFITWARRNNIYVGPGRGSAAGSLVSYCLGITNLDPLRWDLLFERFLNPDRISMPDIDVDFEKRWRDRVIEYVTQKYGRERVAHIGTFGKQRAKAAVRSVCKTLGFPYAIGDKLSKLLLAPVHGKPQTLATSLEKVKDLKDLYESDGAESDILKWAEKLEDSVSNAGVHASGIVISNTILTEDVPLFRGRGGEITTQWEMNNIERVGLIKFDFLGLDALEKIHRCVDFIKERHNIDVNIDNIDLEDEAVFAKLREGDTVGIFQLEASSGIRDLLVQIRPMSVEDLIATVAIYRPGPLDAEYKDTYLGVRAGKNDPVYLVPELEPVLKRTEGWLIYQEQAMQIAKELCGYSGGEADSLRKAIGKKKEKLMAEHESKFKAGWEANGLPKDKGAILWDQLKAFASYSFNRTVDKDTKIDTLNGAKRIEDCSKGDIVFTLEPNGKVVPAQVVALHDHGTVPLWEIEFDDGTIEKCTLDHKWLTEWGQQPLWKILDLDCEVWGSANDTKAKIQASEAMQKMCKSTIQDGSLDLQGLPRKLSYKEVINLTQKKVPTICINSKEWYSKYNRKNIPVWYESKDAARRSKEAQTKVQKVSDDTMADQSTNLQENDSYFRNKTEILRDSEKNCIQTRDNTTEIQSASTMEKEKSREISTDTEKSVLKSKKIKDGDLVRTIFNQIWFQTKRPDTVPGRTQTSGFYQQRSESNPRGGWTVAFSTGTWRRNITEDTNKRQNVRSRNYQEKKLEISENIYGELQSLWRTYKDKLGEPLYFINKWESPTYSMHRKIIRVSYIGMQQGYDIEVDHPEHNFLLSSGLCCSNSHAASYAYITYQTAWLKTHYPTEFMCAVMVCEADDHDDIIKCLTECRRLGIQVLPPDINNSDMSFTVSDNNTILFGLAPIKNLGASVNSILEERKIAGPFSSFKDFCNRVDLSKVNRKKVESLIKAGAFDQFGSTRASLLHAVELIWNYNDLVKSYRSKLETYEKKVAACEQRLIDIAEGKHSEKGNLLKPLSQPSLPVCPEYPELISVDEMSQNEIRKAEHELLGFYVSSHPLDSLAMTDISKKLNTVEDIKEMPSQSHISIAAVVTNSNEITTKKRQKMAFVVLEDLTGSIEAVCFPRMYEQHKELLEETVPLKVDGVIEVTEADDKRVTKIKVTNMSILDMGKTNAPQKLPVDVPAERAKDLMSLLYKHTGNFHEVDISLSLKDGTKVKVPTTVKIADCKGAFDRDLARIKDESEQS